MIMQGVWMNNFIKKYAPAGFEYGAAAFPEETEHPGAPLTIAETDILVIPAGARHPKEAMQFIAFVAQQKNTAWQQARAHQRSVSVSSFAEGGPTASILAKPKEIEWRAKSREQN